jgi:predicted dehydrogenase
MNQRVRWGVIGAGGIARRRTIPEGILPARNAQLMAVYDPVREANETVAGQFGVRAAGTVEELLVAGIDAVYIASPPAAHRDQVLACARAGKHVLCEKPLGLTVAEVESIIAACAQATVRLGAAFMMRFHAQHQAALTLIREGALGKTVFARAQLSCWYPPMPGAWRQDPDTGGGGSLIDMGGHCIDLLEMLLGPVASVSCCTRRSVHAYASEDSAVAMLQFESGALGVVDAFFCIPDEASQNRLEIYGSLGSILASGTIGQGDGGEMTITSKRAGAGYDAQQARAAAEAKPVKAHPVNTYQAEIEEFSQAILDDREPANHGLLGLRSQQVLAACYESARTGRMVRTAHPH